MKLKARPIQKYLLRFSLGKDTRVYWGGHDKLEVGSATDQFQSKYYTIIDYLLEAEPKLRSYYIHA